MVIVRFIGRKAAVAVAMSSVLAGCSSVEREQKLAAAQAGATEQNAATVQNQMASADGQPGVQYNAALPVNQQTVPLGSDGKPMAQATVLVKTSRLPVPVPSEAETVSVQTAAMASPTMAPILVFKPQPISAAIQPAEIAAAQPLGKSPTGLQNASPTQSLLLANAAASPKSGRLVSPLIAPAVAAGRIQPAAAEAIALDEPELTPDMVALQSVIPTPKPIFGSGTSTLAYAAQPKTVAAVSAIDSGIGFPPAPGDPLPDSAAESPPELSKLIKRYAGLYGVPESLVHRVVHRESKYDPKAYHKNGYWGLMQIKYSTAKSMGYQGKPEGLLDAETNLKYAIKYLRGAWLVADNKNDNAIKLYARGYYYDAKRKDLLHVIDGSQGITPIAFATAPNNKSGL
jgi:soluble lytic murein transglycosylase-like protein